MIIHIPKITYEDKVICLTADIEWESEAVLSSNWLHYLPKTLWYKVDKKYADSVSKCSNAFLIPLVSVAMYYNENIEVRGEISEHLAYNLQEYQRILNFWNPEWFSIVSISYAAFSDTSTIHKKSGAVCSYSGGVDSSYTLYSHLPENEPLKDYQVTHTMYIRGFETSEEDRKTQEAKIKSYTELMDSLDINLVVTETNAREFQQFAAGSITYYMTWGSVLAGSTMLLDNLVGRYYFSADNTHDYPIILTINHVTLPLLSTEKLDISCHGASVSKLEKVKIISKWPKTYERLIVCFDNPNGLTNCSQCVKCTLTMNLLDMNGTLDLYKTFVLPINRSLVRKTRHRKPFIYTPIKWIEFAKTSGRSDLVFDYTWVLWASRMKLMVDALHDQTNSIRNPLQSMYKLSAVLKRKYPRYAKCIHVIKKQRHVA